ncbi:class I adenylate-forming enzyme family protein [Mycobacterium sp. CVI_P3]|uniref:Class I adenylate-forming enzyme family protein n=1 Tax=Mycobacterium pinniadriaticum TaxID=2994102 RepID=A0ABT3SBV9_9MYCO|nr:class I adenylate-forming enzyme family protein [Mycobacterium pinniadriaticum]MCX2929984.1 class I adenylate-forming enzyme family protein [Mycobacterium pinniadriaticum]MCX2936367.1 class I adenylate-forming enzyme family protein [Mycobacterium pinniadriaticum]
MPLADWLDRCAARFAERPFVITDEVTLSYRQVADESELLASGLAALGVVPGDRVGMVIANCAEFVTVKFAIARLGAIAVPFNYLYRQDELRYVLADSGCRVVVTMSRFGHLDYGSMLDGIVPGWDGPGFADRPVKVDDPLSTVRAVVLTGPDTVAPRPGALCLDDVMESGCPPTSVTPDAPADMLYTSGSTGFPKGVVTSHDAVLRTAYASALTRAYQDGRRILFSLPCYHMFAYIEGLLSAMFVGGAVILQPTFSAEGYFAGIEEHAANDMLCVPTMALAMVESPARRDFDLSSLRAVLCGSAPAPIRLWQQIRDELGVKEIVTGYGMTECGGAMALTLPEDPLTRCAETVGRPKIAGTAGVDGSDALVVYDTVDGELVSRGPTTMIGYWNRPQDTAAALRDGWLHSGDLGSVGADGYLRVTGRSKELYKSGGELVMPKEIEDLLAAYDDISQVFAIGLTDDRWGEIGCVVVVPVPGASLTEDEVLARCRTRLARFKVPKKVVLCTAEQLPTTATGKVQKFRLVDQLQGR